MKPGFLVLFLILGLPGLAQQNPEEAALQQTVERFFEGFHQQDSVLIRSVMADAVIMQSVGTRDGQPSLRNESFGNFLRSLVSIPAGTSFREELHSFSIQVDGNMANVWTPYSFYTNENLSHCGVNSFQLVKDSAGEWKIFYLVDTRTKQGCPVPEKQKAGKWDDAMLRFEAEDKEHPPEPGVILFTGSSSIAMWKGLEQDFPDHRVLNRGFGGSEFSDLLDYSHRVIYSYRPSKIFIYEGDNDLAAGESIATVLSEARQLREEIRERFPNTPVIFISPKPSLSRWYLKQKYQDFNEALKNYTQSTALTEFADVWSPMLNKQGLVRDELFLKDGLHMNEQGYAIWKEALRPYLD